MHGMSIIGWLESQEFFPLIALRNTGLRWVENSEILKNSFLQQATGLSILNKTRYVSWSIFAICESNIDLILQIRLKKYEIVVKASLRKRKRLLNFFVIYE